ncbi:MAG: hypothetical protein ACKOW2_02445 [Sphingobacteriaceae bacterium]
MLLKNIFTKMLIKASPSSFETLLNLHLAVELSFEANVQVSYKDENDYLKIKRFRSNSWNIDFFKERDLVFPLEMKVFIYTPNLSKDEEVKLRVKMDGNLREEKTFVIPMENEYAGWFELNLQSQN